MEIVIIKKTLIVNGSPRKIGGTSSIVSKLKEF
jgi:hypothetical protein